MVLAAFLAMKGGAGKTTSSMFVATGLAKQTDSVAVLDYSPQRSAHKWWTHGGARTEWGFDVIEGDAAGTDNDITKQITRTRRKYDHVLVDPPPEITPIIVPIIRSVEIVVGCVQPTWLDMEQAPELAEMVAANRDPDGLPILSWVFTRSVANTVALGSSHRVMSRAEQTMFATEIRNWQRYDTEGQAITKLHGYADLLAEILALDETLD
jgi:chromosome partitioning protein